MKKGYTAVDTISTHDKFIHIKQPKEHKSLKNPQPKYFSSWRGFFNKWKYKLAIYKVFLM